MAWLWRRLFGKSAGGGATRAGPRGRETAATSPGRGSRPRATPPAGPRHDPAQPGLEAVDIPALVGTAAQPPLGPGERSHAVALAHLVLDVFQRDRLELPAFPWIAIRIFELVEHPDADLHELVTLVSQDPAVAAQVMSVANSAFYSPAQPITSIRDAVAYLGLEQVASVAVAASASSIFDLETRAAQERFGDLWLRHWRHSMTTAFAAGAAAMEHRLADPQRGFLAGTLHDIGKTIGLKLVSGPILAARVPFPVPDPVLEVALDITHTCVGGDMARQWNLPPYLAAVIAHHHERRDAARSGPELEVVKLVSAIDEIRTGRVAPAAKLAEALEAAADLGLSPAALRAVVTQVKDLAARTFTLHAAAPA